MKHRVAGITALSLLVVSAAVFALSIYSGGAAKGNDSPPYDDSEFVIVPRLAQPSGGPAGDGSMADAISMIDRWTSSLLGSPGWLHVKEEILQENMEVGTLPDGSPIPKDYVFDSWYLLDGKGFAIAGFSQMLDMSGSLIQASVYKNNTWTNLTYDIDSASEPFSPALDHGLALDLKSVGAGGRITSAEEDQSEIQGKAVRVVTTHEVFTSPVSLAGISGSVAEIVKHADFDPKSGQLQTYETLYRTVEGKELRLSLVTVLVAEKVDSLPPEIESFLLEEPR